MLASCNNEDTIAAGNENTQQGEAYLSVSLVGSDNGASRTQPGQGTDDGEDYESTISSVMVLLADESGNITSYTPSLTTIEGVRTTERIAVNAGTTYEVYVIANPPANYTAPSTKEALQKTGDDAAIISNISSETMKTYAGEDNFLMFSACHGTDQVDGAEVTVTSADTYDDPATVTVQLDRLAAKITYDAKDLDFADAQAMFGNNNALTDVEIEGFALVNGVTKTYLQQHWSNVAATNINSSNPATAPYVEFENTLITPAVTNNGADDFYSRWEDYSTITPSQTNPGWYDAVVDEVRDDEPSPFTTGPLYCMENNSGSTAANCFIDNVTDLNGNTTGVLFKAQATVTGSDEKAGENCFYGYEGEYFATLAALVNKYPSVFGEQVNVENVATALKNAHEGTPAEDSDIKTVADFREKYNVRVFEDGTMYYTHYIMDQNYTANKNGEQVNYHSVMRNTIYGLTVTSVIGIGDDVPGGWNPDIEEEKPVVPPTYLRVRCIVNPWVLSNYNVTLQ